MFMTKITILKMVMQLGTVKAMKQSIAFTHISFNKAIQAHLKYITHLQEMRSQGAGTSIGFPKEGV